MLLGVLANVLVCLAVWMCFAARTVVDKVLAIMRNKFGGHDLKQK